MKITGQVVAFFNRNAGDLSTTSQTARYYCLKMPTTSFKCTFFISSFYDFVLNVITSNTG